MALIGVVTLRFSRNYLHREIGFHRFFIFMCLFLAGMLLIVLSGNAVFTFVGWELAGVSSWLLIGYAYDRPIATGNALWAFITNRIGDAGFILGISLAAWWLGTVEWSGLAAWAQGDSFDKISARLILFGFLIAAVAKSAQLPFASWIARALEGPTPSSAIFYGAVMVHAGVYLVLRLEPVLLQVPDVMVYLAVLGIAHRALRLARRADADRRQVLPAVRHHHPGRPDVPRLRSGLVRTGRLAHGTARHLARLPVPAGAVLHASRQREGEARAGLARWPTVAVHRGAAALLDRAPGRAR